MKDKRLLALLNLLDDPDTEVYKSIEQEFLKESITIIPELEKVWESTLDELIQARIETIIQHLQFNDTKEKLRKWSARKKKNILDGLFLLTRYQYPDIKSKSYKEIIEKITRDIWLELNNRLTSLEKVTVLNHVFYDIHKFSINLSNPQTPQNSYINHILETKKANPVSMALLYAYFAREADLPVYFINFPKNPLLAYVDEKIARKAHGESFTTPTLFYINPSNKGAIVSSGEVEYFLKKNDYASNPEYFDPCSDNTMMKKLVDKLIYAYESLGNMKKVKALKSLKKVI